jgi:hypothetical protein
MLSKAVNLTMASVVILNVVIELIMVSVINTERHYAWCIIMLGGIGAECRYPECHGAHTAFFMNFRLS